MRLLVVDMQKGLFTQRPLRYDAEKEIPRVNRLYRDSEKPSIPSNFSTTIALSGRALEP